jgi:hypothetical protein
VIGDLLFALQEAAVDRPDLNTAAIPDDGIETGDRQCLIPGRGEFSVRAAGDASQGEAVVGDVPGNQGDLECYRAAAAGVDTAAFGGCIASHLAHLEG